MKSTLFVASLLLTGIVQAEVMSSVRTSGEIETSCRIKAKEIAAETYRGCVTEQKNSQIEQIKKEYAAKLQALKAHYEQELKKMNQGEAAKKSDDIDSNATEKNDSVKKESAKAETVTKKPAKKQVAVKTKKTVEKAPVATSSSSGVSEMTVQLKQAPATPSSDESTMDLPEPIPVENLPSETSI